MKLIYCIFPLALISSASAETQVDPSIAVFASQARQGTVVMGQDVSFVKTFNVALVNSGDKPIDLAKGCFSLSASAAPDDDSKFSVDTIDEKLTTGDLAPQKSVKGFVEFAGNNQEIYDANVVRFLSSCDG